MGTPQFAVPSLEALCDVAEVAAVVTQPARPTGRGLTPTPSAVETRARKLGLSVLTPERLKEIEADLRAMVPELILLVAYGKLVPPNLLKLPPHGALNIHPSLLPRHRGPSPIAGALLEGDRKTGVTLMVMTGEMDAGPIVAQKRVLIESGETAEELEARLAGLAAQLVREAVPEWVAGRLEAVPQDARRATTTRLLKKEDGRLDWRQPAERLERRVRALAGWPGTYTHWRGKLLKVWRAGAEDGRAAPGLVLPELRVGTGQGLLRLEEVQIEGRRRMDAQAFLNGYGEIVGERLES